MSELISPKYQMLLIKELNETIWRDFTSYKEVKFYIDKWHIVESSYNDFWENFTIVYKSTGDIDLLSTLHGIDGNILLKMAVDLGVETPDFIPSVATFRNEIRSDYSTASSTFEKAFKEVETHPDIAVGLANSALESIIKEILKDKRIRTQNNGKKTLYDLTSELLKELQLFPNSEMPIEIRTIGSSFLAVNEAIEKLRSEKTFVHGKTAEDYIIKDSLYTYFVINAVTTIGRFLISFYKNKFPKQVIEQKSDDDLPF